MIVLHRVEDIKRKLNIAEKRQALIDQHPKLD